MKCSSVPVVLLHGWGFDHRVWQPLVDMLQKDREVIAIDLPGFGEIPAIHHFDDCLSHLTEVLPKGALYCGWSMGGVIATALYEKVEARGIITLATHPYWSDVSALENMPWSRFAVMAMPHRPLQRVARIWNLPSASPEVLQKSLLWCSHDCRDTWASPSVPMQHHIAEDDVMVPKTIAGQLPKERCTVWPGGHDFWWHNQDCQKKIAQQLQAMET